MSMRHVFALRAAIGATSASAARSTTLLRTTRTWDGAEIEYPRTRCPEVHAVVVEIPANGATPVHLHSVSNYVFVMEGLVTVEEGDMAGGGLHVERASTFRKGDAFAEVVNKWHRGRAGPEGVKILVWYTSELGREFTVLYRPGYEIGSERSESSRCEPSRGAAR